MTTEITIKCCDGVEKYTGECLKDRCPIYLASKDEVLARWPRAHSGFDSFYIYGEPGHDIYLHQVAQDIQNKKTKAD